MPCGTATTGSVLPSAGNSLTSANLRAASMMACALLAPAAITASPLMTGSSSSRSISHLLDDGAAASDIFDVVVGVLGFDLAREELRLPRVALHEVAVPVDPERSANALGLRRNSSDVPGDVGGVARVGLDLQLQRQGADDLLAPVVCLLFAGFAEVVELAGQLGIHITLPQALDDDREAARSVVFHLLTALTHGGPPSCSSPCAAGQDSPVRRERVVKAPSPGAEVAEERGLLRPRVVVAVWPDV